MPGKKEPTRPKEMTRKEIEEDEKEIGKNIPKEMIGLDTEDV